MNLPEAIKKALKLAGMRQIDLATALGCRPSGITALIKGGKHPSHEKVEKISAATGCTFICTGRDKWAVMRSCDVRMPPEAE